MTGIEFELESVAFVCGSDEVGLLRIAGRWFAPANRLLDEIVLTVTLGPETLELRPLPDLSGVARVASPAGEEWRAAFMMNAQIAEDPRTEFVLSAGDDGHVALPRPGEWAEAEPEADSPVVADLVSRLDDVANMDDVEPAPPDRPAEPDDHADLELMRVELETTRRDLEVERRRRASLAEDLRAQLSVEEDLRRALASQEAELASAAEQASQTARAAERRREPPPRRSGEDADQRSRPADEEFLSRLERARRASETVA